MNKNKISDEKTGKPIKKKSIDRVQLKEVKILQTRLEMAEYLKVIKSAKLLGVSVSKYARDKILGETEIQANIKAAAIKMTKEIEEKLNENYKAQYKKLTEELNQKYKDTIAGEILKGVQAVFASMTIDEFIAYNSVSKKTEINPVLAELNFGTEEEQQKLFLQKTRED